MAKHRATILWLSLLLNSSHAEVENSCAKGGGACHHVQTEEVDETAHIQIRGDAQKWKPHRGRKWHRPPPPGVPSCRELFTVSEELKFPEVVRSPVTLIAQTTPLCIPGTDLGVWYTRGFGMPGKKASILGPTIMTRPGENLAITVRNHLRNPSPECNDPQVIKNTMEFDIGVNDTCGGCSPFGAPITNVIWYCKINTTNIHTHGLHVTPLPPAGDQSVFQQIDPHGSHTLNVTLPPNHGAGNMWYHAQVLHSMRAQAGGGMAGALIVEDMPNTLPPEFVAMEKVLLFIQLIDMRPENRAGNTNPAPAGATTTGLENNPASEFVSAGDLWSVDGKIVYGDNYYLFTNGQFKPYYTMTENKFYRFQITFVAIASNVALVAAPLDDESLDNGFQCEFGLLAKDGVYLDVAPRPVDVLWLSMGGRAEVAARCWCSKRGRCVGNLLSQPCVGSPQEPGGPPVGGFDETAPRTLCGTNNALNNAETPTQPVLQIRVERNRQRRYVPRRFKVSRPCYLADTREGCVDDSTVVVMPGAGPPISPQFQAVFITTPEDRLKAYADGSMQGGYFEVGNPPIKYFEVGTLQELWFDGGINESDPDNGPLRFKYPLPASAPETLFPNQIQTVAGPLLHPLHLHVTPYQVTAMKCNNGRWITEGSCGGDTFFEVGDWQDNMMFAGGAYKVRFQTSTFVGNYFFHCHILGHADGGMDAYFKVYGNEGTEYPAQERLDPRCYKGLRVPKYQYVDPPDQPRARHWKVNDFVARLRAKAGH